MKRALLESLGWLERVGMIARDYQSGKGELFFLTRQAYLISNDEDFNTMTWAVQVPRHLFHPDVDAAAYPDLLSGRRDTAVLKAFREVEVALRRATGNRSHAAKIDGLLVDLFTNEGQAARLVNAPTAKEDQVKLRAFCASGMAYFRNSTAHDRVDMPLTEAIHAIIIASYLRWMIEAEPWSDPNDPDQLDRHGRPQPMPVFP